MRCLLLLALLAGAAVAERPRVVVVVSVDQLRPDVLLRYRARYTGGLKRLLDGGRLFAATQDHGTTETGPGHSTLLTGCRPNRTGIVANAWIDRRTLQPVYCVDDPASPVFGVADTGRSPKQLLRDALGDWLRRAHPGSRVYAVAGKDRAAVTMAGRHPNGAYWFDKKAKGLTTSAYYHPAGLPDWLAALNTDGWFASLPAAWTYEPHPDVRADDDPREADRYGRAAPHPLQDDDRARFFDRFYRTPFLDTLVLRAAGHLAVHEGLGDGETPDLLCVGLSATDIVGHLYGPYSQEVHDTLLRLDRNLGHFLDLLDRRGRAWTLALTADHGVLPLPEMTRVDVRRLVQPVMLALQRRWGAGDWFRIAGNQVTVHRVEAARKGVPVAEVARALSDALVALDAVAAAPTAADLAAEGGGALLAYTRKSYRADRSGDVVVIPKPGFLITPYAQGTSHGSPHPYDREVPLLLYGAGIAAGRADAPARTIDIAPTLARLLGLAVPADLDGAPLPLE